MGALKNRVGEKFGKLTVLERGPDYVSPKGNKKVQWLCQCECGNTKLVRGNDLVSGRTQSCGCLIRETRIQNSLKLDNDIIGKTFGDLIPLSRVEAPNAKDSVFYLCKCSCGNISKVQRMDLLKQRKTHCGCKNPVQYIDLTGQTFGKLTVLKPGETINEKKYWICQCECGTIKSILGDSLRKGLTLSCGCLKQSHGELLIERILQQHNIPYEKEVSLFERYRFDFYINKTYLVEYDGSQHFEARNSGWNTQENLEKTQERDRVKNEWCREHHIPLIRIPYTKYPNITIDDLLLETTTFLV